MQAERAGKTAAAVGLVWASLGGAVGAGARFLVGKAALSLPWSVLAGTLFVNVVGSFVLALISGHLLADKPQLRVFLGTGMMGGFTTYSTFNLEVLKLFERQQYAQAGLYAGLTFVLCLLAGGVGCWLGYAKGP